MGFFSCGFPKTQVILSVTQEVGERLWLTHGCSHPMTGLTGSSPVGGVSLRGGLGERPGTHIHLADPQNRLGEIFKRQFPKWFLLILRIDPGICVFVKLSK